MHNPTINQQLYSMQQKEGGLREKWFVPDCVADTIVTAYFHKSNTIKHTRTHTQT